MEDVNMADMAQGALFILPCAFLYGLTVFLFRDQIKSIPPPPWPLIWINSLTSREENMPVTFVISWERKMSVVVQYVVRPNPGIDPAKITELAKEGAVLWRKHGGKVTYWSVAVGEVGNRVLSITFENFAAWGAAVDKMAEDKEVRAWQAKRMKAGYTTWVRSNMATEIEI